MKPGGARVFGNWARPLAVVFFLSAFLLAITPVTTALAHDAPSIDLGLSAGHFKEGEQPDGWSLRDFFGLRRGASAEWVVEDGTPAVRLRSEAALTFLRKEVDIDVKEYPAVTWKWKVENVLDGVDERTVAGDDHPIRIFFVFEPEPTGALWPKVKRFVMGIIHGHPHGRYTEYLWASGLKAGSVVPDPTNPRMKLMVVEGGRKGLGKWLSYRRNLYEDFIRLYGAEPGRLIFVGILNDTDQTGQTATSFISDLDLHKGTD